MGRTIETLLFFLVIYMVSVDLLFLFVVLRGLNMGRFVKTERVLRKIIRSL